MIRPLTNAYRLAIDLSGIWRIRFDPEGRDWSGGTGTEGVHEIAVPGSWNEQLAEAGFMNHIGTAWLETRLFVPAEGTERHRILRFASADYFADVWVNGRYAGSSGAPMLPFEIDVTELTTPGQSALLVVKVSNLLPADGPTQGVSIDDYRAEGRERDEYWPAVRFDFFPYGGINRPVHLVLRPPEALLGWRPGTRIDGHDGLVTVTAEASGGSAVRILNGGESAESALMDGSAEATVRLPDCRFWSPNDPALHDLAIELLDGGGNVIDLVEARIGVREVRVEGRSVLLNGEPILLKGFGKHEDSPVRGRGLDLPLLVKDFGLLEWIGANSVRTSHYPYAEEFLDMADRRGLLVIGEAFSINLDFRKVGEATLDAHKRAVSELIARDCNHPCVIAWSLANEPGFLGEAEYRERSGEYWRELFAYARALDATRPLTHANVQHAGNDDPAFEHVDFISFNRYRGWYSEPGQIARGAKAFEADLDALAAYGKPLFVSEFGADALAGEHATYDQMFTEEYQADLIKAYWDAISAHSACIGGHVWNFADFRTSQHSRRVILNLKGVFTRGREPKRAAWMLRDLWRASPAEKGEP